MAWISAVAGLAGSLLSGDSGSSTGISRTPETDAAGMLIGEQLPQAIGARTNAINVGTNLEVGRLLESLGFLQGQFGTADAALRENAGLSLDSLRSGANNALAFQRPLIDAGGTGINLLEELAQNVTNGTFFNENDPAFKFQVRQGNNAINGGANAAGLLNSGGRTRELAKFNQDYASTFKTQELNNRLATINPLANIGVGALNRSSDISNNLGVNSSNVFNQLGANLSNNATNLGVAGSNILGQIGNVENQGLVNAGESTFQGLLAQINAFNSLTNAQTGVAANSIQSDRINAAQRAANAQAIGQALGAIGAQVFGSGS